MTTHKVEWNECSFQADLCKEHAKPLLDFVAGFPSHFTVKRASGAKKSFQIHTMDEIERLKKNR